MSSSITTVVDSQTARVADTPTSLPPAQSRSVLVMSHASGLTGAASGVSTGVEGRRAPTGELISMDILYQAREAGSKHFGRAMELLARAVDHLSEARRAGEDGDEIASLTEILQFEALLPDLFACRAIGDGFANVVNSVHLGIANLDGDPLKAVQITAIWRIFRELAIAPYLSFSDSIKIIRQMKLVGLELNGEFLTDWASGESISAGESVR
jgi:hypothetical protein